MYQVNLLRFCLKQFKVPVTLNYLLHFSILKIIMAFLKLSFYFNILCMIFYNQQNKSFKIAIAIYKSIIYKKKYYLPSKNSFGNIYNIAYLIVKVKWFNWLFLTIYKEKVRNNNWNIVNRIEDKINSLELKEVFTGV